MFRYHYTSANAEQIDTWLQATLDKIAAQKQNADLVTYQPSVQALADLIETDGVVRMYVTEMLSQACSSKLDGCQTICNRDLLDALNYIVQHAPEYNANPDEQNFFPMSALFVHMMYSLPGSAVFRNQAFNAAIRTILQAWCDFLDSPASLYVLNTGENGWLSPSAYKEFKLDEYIIPDPEAPHWGFASFNAFFHRRIKPECRPINTEPNVIVSANDGTVYRIAYNVQKSDTFWLKSQPYSLINMLDNSEYTDRFVGGDLLQSFLSKADYHRWHAPIDGTVKEARVINGLMFSELLVMGFDPHPGILSQGYEASVNTRGLVIIESKDPVIGMVCVIPIGITEISSVRIEVNEGDWVNKGDELGYFSYGGSSMCLVFQPDAIEGFTVELGDRLNVNASLAIAKSV